MTVCKNVYPSFFSLSILPIWIRAYWCACISGSSDCVQRSRQIIEATSMRKDIYCYYKQHKDQFWFGREILWCTPIDVQDGLRCLCVRERERDGERNKWTKRVVIGCKHLSMTKRIPLIIQWLTTTIASMFACIFFSTAASLCEFFFPFWVIFCIFNSDGWSDRETVTAADVDAWSWNASRTFLGCWCFAD